MHGAAIYCPCCGYIKRSHHAGTTPLSGIQYTCPSYNIVSRRKSPNLRIVYRCVNDGLEGGRCTWRGEIVAFMRARKAIYLSPSLNVTPSSKLVAKPQLGSIHRWKMPSKWLLPQRVCHRGEAWRWCCHTRQQRVVRPGVDGTIHRTEQNNEEQNK